MAHRLRVLLGRLWTWLWSRRDPVAAEPPVRDRRVEARARFWAEFREGQREAEAQRSRLR